MNRQIVLALCGLLFCYHGLMAQEENQFNDGPYLFFEQEEWIMRWITENQVEEASLAEWKAKLGDAFFNDFFDPADLNEAANFLPDTSIRFEGVSKIAAISDPHGQNDITLELLEANEVIDEEGNWAFGEGHLIIAGDIFDRGPKVTELLWWVHRLEQQAAKAGGKVHFILGNHEQLIFHGDMRYLHKKYRYTCALLGATIDSLFSPSTYLGKWLRSKPVAISVNNIGFIHAGISPTVLDGISNFEDMNRIFKDSIFSADPYAIAESPSLAPFFFEESPLWYRGYFISPLANQKQIKKTLKRYELDHLVVGHTPQEEIVSLFGGRVFGIDSSLLTGSKGEVLFWEDGQFYRGKLSGNRIKL